jgi:hypothetical protein
MAELEGRAAIVANAARDVPAPDDGEGEQGDLLGLPTPDGMEPSRGPGRPPGRRNRRTEERANYLLSRYPSPLEGLAQIAAMPVAELAKRLGCTPLEALQEQRLSRIALAPYVHARMPVAISTDKPLVHLTIGSLLAPGESEVIQGLIDAPDDGLAQ